MKEQLECAKAHSFLKIRIMEENNGRDAYYVIP